MAHQPEPVVYVSNLPYEATAPVVEDAFETEGLHIAHVELLKKGTGSRAKSCGLAAVTLKDPKDKEKATQVMDGKLVYGRPMIVRLDKFVEDNLDYHK